MVSFGYTGAAQSYTVPETGYYVIECWGAYCSDTGYRSDAHRECGGYTKGKIILEKGEVLHLYIGAAGQNFNYGTQGYRNNGGGATDVRLIGGTWNDTTSLRSRIMVAGGAGNAGGLNSWNSGVPYGGSGGGLVGEQGGTIDTGAGGTGGTQTSGYAFGVASGSPGGGNGYYSGKSGYLSNGVAGTGGGSSFISGHEGCDAITESGTHTGQSIHYSGRYFTETVMASGNENMPSPVDGTTVKGYVGNGIIHITFIGPLDERDHYDIIQSGDNQIVKFNIEKVIDESSYIENVTVILDDKEIDFGVNSEIELNLLELCDEERDYEIKVQVSYFIEEYSFSKTYEKIFVANFKFYSFEPLPEDASMLDIINRMSEYKNYFNATKSKLGNIIESKSFDSEGKDFQELIMDVNELDVIGEARQILLDQEFFDANFTFNNYSKNTLTGYNNTLGFKFVGAGNNSSSSSTAPHFSQCLTCEFYYDLTDIDTIKFHARKITNHGLIWAGVLPISTTECTTVVTPDVVVYLHYNSAPTAWTEYTLDVSKLTGSYYIFFLGGYVDQSGLTTSETQYSNIRLTKLPYISLPEVVEYDKLNNTAELNDVVSAFENVKEKMFNIKNLLYSVLLNKNADVNENESLYSLVNKVKSLSYIYYVTFDTDYINNNGKFLNHTKSIITGYNNTAGISITGRPSSSGYNNATVIFRCEFVIDFTNVSEVSFYAMKGANHGTMDVNITDGYTTAGIASQTFYGRKEVHYNSLATSWTKYTIDTTEVTGTRTLSFIGGWYDQTGNTASNTRYSNITLKYMY